MKSFCCLVSYPDAIPREQGGLGKNRLLWRASSDSATQCFQHFWPLDWGWLGLSVLTQSMRAGTGFSQILLQASCWPLPKIYLKLRILQVSIHLPPAALKSPFYNLLSSLKRELQIGFICKTNWLFRNSAFGTTAIPEIRSWRKDLPNKNTACCLKVNFLVFKVLLCFRSFSFFTNNFHPLVVPVPTQHSLWLCSTSWVQQDSKKRHLWFFLKTRTSKASAHSKQPAMQSLRSCSH